jgi:thiamine biosynthesis lipoprotein
MAQITKSINRKNVIKLLIPALTFIVTAIFLLTPLSCSHDSRGDNVHRKHRFFRMDTVVEITVSVPQSFNAKPLWRSVDSLLSQSENRFSITGSSSEINPLNERASNALSISQELGDMLKTGLAYGDTLGGAFDITVLPLKELWGFCEQCGDDDPLPDSNQVSAAIQYVDYRLIQVNDAGDTVFFESPNTRVDVGGIAKGYVLRWLDTLLRNNGVGNFVIAAGGDIVASGRKRGNAPWTIGVQHPRNRSELIATIPLENGAIVTSGDYERFRIVNGNRYHHIFDPSAGYSCGENQSVTIRAADPVRADIMSTGLFCRTAEEILAFVNARDDIECFVVDHNGDVHLSDGWESGGR